MSALKFKHELLKIRCLDSDQVNVTARELVVKEEMIILPAKRFDVLPG